MDWRLKSLIQRTVARLLPGACSNACYYQIQKSFGNLKNETESRVLSAIEIGNVVGNALIDASVLEVGTGRRLNVPIVLWLLGAKEVISVDLNRYLRPELVAADIDYYRIHRKWLEDSLVSLRMSSDCVDRLNRLLSVSASSSHELVNSLFRLCRVTYVAPTEAAAVGFETDRFDIHVSTHVLEHVTPNALVQILEDGARILKSGGTCVHLIDLSDHFAHSDGKISRVNFLQFDENKWSHYAGNRFMYMNRLRASDYLDIFRHSGFQIIRLESGIDHHCLHLIRSGVVPIAEYFRGKDVEDLATLRLLVCGKIR